MKLKYSLLVLPLVLASVACNSKGSNYRITKVEKERIELNSNYDREVPEATEFLSPFKKNVDSIMGQVVGTAKKVLEKGRPESPLSNLLADIMVNAGPDFGEKPVMGFYNMGGIRTNSIPGGTVTWGDILSVAPFENKICFLNLTGENLLKLFENMAKRGGEAVSKGIAIKMNPEGKVLSVTFNGKPIDPKASYRIATNPYVAEGNDGLVALKEKTDYVCPKTSLNGDKNDVRFIIRRYFEQSLKNKKPIDANIEGRIVVVK
ncbi:MAG TPA: hypothetical protein DDY68_04250 [Porphyromonadaceae bacterium]|nr:hypothetical protein [Porphyromonadaceae bacterium]